MQNDVLNKKIQENCERDSLPMRNYIKMPLTSENANQLCNRMRVSLILLLHCFGRGGDQMIVMNGTLGLRVHMETIIFSFSTYSSGKTTF